MVKRPGLAYVRHCAALLGSILTVACGATPTNPSSGNAAPIIVSLTAQGLRSREPANFADLGEAIPMAVDVTDAESRVSDLTFVWTASAGTFSGSGPRVVWKAPATARTPALVNVNVEVLESYRSGGTMLENGVFKATTISLHDSEREVSDLARQFLLDFSDSSLQDVSYVLRNFEPTCYGTENEAYDVAQNRESFRILESRIDMPQTTIQFGGVCPYRFPFLRGDACAQVRSYWKSVAKKDLSRPSGELYMKAGQTDVQNGVDQVAAMYYPAQQRWKLCDSSWNADAPAGAPALLRGLVP